MFNTLKVFCILLAFIFNSVNAQKNNIKSPNFETGSAITDLANVPIFVSFIRDLALSIRDDNLEIAFKKQVFLLEDSILNTLNQSPPGYGYLIGVNFYIDQFGTPVIPGGSLVYPIGASYDPMHALVKRNRIAVISAQVPNLINAKKYIWITESNGQLISRTYNKQERIKLEKGAHEYEIMEQRLARWFKVGSSSLDSKIRRLEYWSKLAIRHGEQLHKTKKLESFNKLVKSFEKSQNEFNDILFKYELELTRLRESKKNLDIMQGIQLILQIMAQADQIQRSGNSSQNNGVSENNNIDYKLELSYKMQVDSSKRQIQELIININANGIELKSLDMMLSDIIKSVSDIGPVNPPLILPKLN